MTFFSPRIKRKCHVEAPSFTHTRTVFYLAFFCAQFIDLVCRGQEIMQFGDGSTSRDYTYISDIVDGVVRSLDRPAGYQIYNLGNGSPVSLSSFIRLVEESVGSPAKIRICPEQPGDVPRTCADVSKARAMLGYNPSVSFADGIRSTVKWYQDRAAKMNAATSNADESISMNALHDARVNRDRSMSSASVNAIAMDKEFCANIGGSRPRSMSSKTAAGPDDALERASRAFSYVSEGSCKAY